MHMRTTLILRDDLMARAAKLMGMKEKTALVHAGLEALIDLSRRLGAQQRQDTQAQKSIGAATDEIAAAELIGSQE